MTPLPVTVQIAPLDPAFRGTPQDLVDAIEERITIETDENAAVIATGSTAPTSNIGPWLKDGNTWYVWNELTGSYVPQILELLPGVNIYDALNPKPFKAQLTADLDIEFAAPASTYGALDFTDTFDPFNVFDGDTFTAPDNGYYHFDAKIGVGVTDGTPGDNVVVFRLNKNGLPVNSENVFDPTFDGGGVNGKTYAVSTMLYLAAGDTVKPAIGFTVGSGTGTWTVYAADTFFSGFKISTQGVF
jgi:hypothetical protein